MTGKDLDPDRILRRIAAERLALIRRKAGLSQHGFASRIDLSAKGYRNYEQGRRELPQSARLRILDQFGQDPVTSADLRAALGSDRGDSSAGPERARSFLAELRAGCRAFRDRSFSRPARVMLALRDNSFVAATAYFTLKTIAVRLDIPFGVEVNGVDWALLASLLVILMISEIPATKIARHLRTTHSRSSRPAGSQHRAGR